MRARETSSQRRRLVPDAALIALTKQPALRTATRAVPQSAVVERGAVAAAPQGGVRLPERLPGLYRASLGPDALPTWMVRDGQPTQSAIHAARPASLSG